MLIYVATAILVAAAFIVAGIGLAENEGPAVIWGLSSGVLLLGILTVRLMNHEIKAEVEKQIQQRTELVEKPSDVQSKSQ